MSDGERTEEAHAWPRRIDEGCDCADPTYISDLTYIREERIRPRPFALLMCCLCGLVAWGRVC